MSTGLLPLFDSYKTVGPDSVRDIRNEIPENPESRCYILNPETCTEEQYNTVKNGTAIIKDWIVIGVKDDQKKDAADGKETQEFHGKVDL